MCHSLQEIIYVGKYYKYYKFYLKTFIQIDVTINMICRRQQPIKYNFKLLSDTSL